MNKNFVRFLSPGTFVPEESVLEIDSWDVGLAVVMASSIEERYGARPYAFQFFTKERGDNELDSHISKRSNLFYLGGRVLTLDDVKREFPSETILIHNMEINGWDKLVVNDNSWSIFQPLTEDDIVLDVRLS